jgi:hypothetical protein
LVTFAFGTESASASSAGTDVPPAFPYPDPLRVAATESSTTFVDLTEQFCPGGVCPAEIGHVTIYRDLHHLTATFVRTQASALQNAVEKAMS